MSSAPCPFGTCAAFLGSSETPPGTASPVVALFDAALSDGAFRAEVLPLLDDAWLEEARRFARVHLCPPPSAWTSVHAMEAPFRCLDPSRYRDSHPLLAAVLWFAPAASATLRLPQDLQPASARLLIAAGRQSVERLVCQTPEPLHLVAGVCGYAAATPATPPAPALPALRSLAANSLQMADESFSPLARHRLPLFAPAPCLSRLELRWEQTYATGRDWETSPLWTAALPASLEHLALSNAGRVFHSGLAATIARCCPRLESLSVGLWDAELDDDREAPLNSAALASLLRALPDLASLSISDVLLTAELTAALASLSRLRQLTMREVQTGAPEAEAQPEPKGEGERGEGEGGEGGEADEREGGEGGAQRAPMAAQSPPSPPISSLLALGAALPRLESLSVSLPRLENVDFLSPMLRGLRACRSLSSISLHLWPWNLPALARVNGELVSLCGAAPIASLSVSCEGAEAEEMVGGLVDAALAARATLRSLYLNGPVLSRPSTLAHMLRLRWCHNLRELRVCPLGLSRPLTFQDDAVAALVRALAPSMPHLRSVATGFLAARPLSLTDPEDPPFSSHRRLASRTIAALAAVEEERRRARELAEGWLVVREGVLRAQERRVAGSGGRGERRVAETGSESENASPDTVAGSLPRPSSPLAHVPASVLRDISSYLAPPMPAVLVC